MSAESIVFVVGAIVFLVAQVLVFRWALRRYERAAEAHREHLAKSDGRSRPRTHLRAVGRH